MKNNALQPDELTQADIIQIAFEIREQTADPEDARRLLSQFCDFYDDRNETIPHELIMHLRDSFRSFLAGEQKLESAFGLKRKRARPKADPKMRTLMAVELLRLRLIKVSHQDALNEVSEKFGWGVSVIGEAWNAHKQDALICLRLERTLDASAWMPDEITRLTEIFGKEPWILAPEKSATKPA